MEGCLKWILQRGRVIGNDEVLGINFRVSEVLWGTRSLEERGQGTERAGNWKCFSKWGPWTSSTSNTGNLLEMFIFGP